jgi:hypothetical protein
MNPFAKLSARQWDILSDLLSYGGFPGYESSPLWVRLRISRWACASESDRVASIRACKSLERRGLIAREQRCDTYLMAGKWAKIFAYKLAVSPRAVINAIDDIEPPSVSEDRRLFMRTCVERIEKQEAKQKRRKAMAERRREAPEKPPKLGPDATPNSYQLDAIASYLETIAREELKAGQTELLMIDARVVSRFRIWFSDKFILKCLDQLKGCGEYDRIIAEARPADPS